MSYPKKEINQELKELAKHFDLDGFANVVIGKDIEGINYIIEVIRRRAPNVANWLENHKSLIRNNTYSHKFGYKATRVLNTIANNMRHYNKIIPKLVEE